MATTRQNHAFQIYQDNFVPQSIPAASNKPRPHLQPSAMPLQPIPNTPAYTTVGMNPPTHPPHHQISPLKSQPLSPHIPQFPDMGYVHIAAPAAGQMYGGSPVKHPLVNKSQQYHHQAIPQQMFNTFSSNLDTFPRDFALGSTPQNESSDFPAPPFARRQQLKRSFSDAAPTVDRSLKRLRSEDDMQQLPDPRDMPPVEDDGNKPGYSYAQMIGMAILRAPQRRLTLAQIYDWISTTFVFYRDDPKQGWHNSIRHNLSLNKAFKKQERPKGDAGKGSYWIIEPGMESQFFKDKIRKSSNIVNIGLQSGMRADIQVMAQPLAEALTPAWSVPVTATAPSVVAPPRPQTAPALPELSSDATLPASDPALNEERAIEATTGSPHPPSSPLVMNSSPPVAISNHHRTISSPVHIRPPPQPRHKRSNTTIEDSGYFSELTSSARRPKAGGVILTSELNIEVAKGKQQHRGRAEEEILRIRSSPHVTPNSRRLKNLLTDLDHSSSPVHPSPSAEFHPSTPAVQFKRPARKPPASVSPNTQLQQHRMRMQAYTDSPIKRLALPEEQVSTFSPNFTPMSQFRSSHFDEQFSIFEDSATPLTPGLASSPLKSIKRPTLLRANTSIGILKDVSGSTKLNTKTPSKVPSLKPAFQPLKPVGSPLKKSMISSPDRIAAASTFDVFDENTFINDDFESTLINDEASSEVGDDGFDLYKGFANIGQSQDSLAKKLSTMKSSRPPLGTRSNTTAF